VCTLVGSGSVTEWPQDRGLNYRSYGHACMLAKPKLGRSHSQVGLK
jgi:hypothetical protein